MDSREQVVPPGFQYREDFISGAEETALLDAIASVTFSAFEMRGVVARRRVAFFGQSYDRVPAGPLPPFLLPLQPLNWLRKLHGCANRRQPSLTRPQRVVDERHVGV